MSLNQTEHPAITTGCMAIPCSQVMSLQGGFLERELSNQGVLSLVPSGKLMVEICCRLCSLKQPTVSALLCSLGYGSTYQPSICYRFPPNRFTRSCGGQSIYSNVCAAYHRQPLNTNCAVY